MHSKLMIKFLPHGDFIEESTVVEVISSNSISIGGEVFDIPSDLMEVDPYGPIHSGFRDNEGTLHLKVYCQYNIKKDGHIWQTPNSDGAYKGDFYEEYPIGPVLPPQPTPIIEETP